MTAGTSGSKRFALLLFCLLPFGLALAPSGTDPAPVHGPDEGRLIFRKTCSACHGRDARGLPGLGKDLVTSRFVRNSTDAALIRFIERGRPADDPANTTGVAMPAKGGNPRLSRQDIADVVAYLRTLEPSP